MTPHATGPCLTAPPRRHERRRHGLILAIAMIASAAFAYAQSGGGEPARAFVAATREYAQMHRHLEQQIGSIEITTPVEQINRIIQQLAVSIRAERVDAKQGDFFTPALAPLLRASIDEALRANDFTAADVINAGRVDGVDYRRILLRVNDTFPWMLGVAMFPCVIEALPPLPPELQYRIVGTDLLLIDVHAILIVDILPSALADLTVR